MKLKGNYYWMFGMQVLSGILAYPCMVQFGVAFGLILALIPFLIGVATTHATYTPDEREMQLIHKTDSAKSMLLIATMLLIYLYVPGVNWFFALIAALCLLRGIVGIVIFTTH